MNISVFGSGRWASFLAWYTSSHGHACMVRGREGSESFEELKSRRSNAFVELNERVLFTSDAEEALRFGELCLIAISAQRLRELCRELKPVLPKDNILVLCMKGLEDPTGLRLTQVVREELGDIPVAVWVGPGHPQDFVRGVPNCMLIDSASAELTRHVADALSSSLIRFYYGEDLIGAEVGAAAKNVVGLAAGMLDGLGMPELKGVLMARGAREISRLVAAMGGDEITVYGLCHLGDYEATLYSKHSHNRGYGECLARGERYPYLAEGVATARSLLHLSRETGAQLPITKAVCEALSGEVSPMEALSGLFTRPAKSEFWSSHNTDIC